LPSVYIGHSAKTMFAECQIFDTRQRLTAVSCRRPHVCRVLDARQISLCRVLFCVEWPTLDKLALYRAQDFAECGSRQSLLCRVLDKKALGKTTGTRQRRGFR
jgi:hypothetical protein